MVQFKNDFLLWLAVPCDETVPPHTYMVDYTTLTFGGTSTLACVTGYEYKQGDYVLTCNSEGGWAGDPLECEGR